MWDIATSMLTFLSSMWDVAAFMWANTAFKQVVQLLYRLLKTEKKTKIQDSAVVQDFQEEAKK